MLSAAEVTRAAGGEGTILSAAPSQSGLKEVGEAVDQSLLRKQGVMRILRPLDDRPCRMQLGAYDMKPKPGQVMYLTFLET